MRDLRPFLFEAIFNRHGSLVVEGDTIKCRAPGGLKHHEREHLRKHKEQLLRIWHELGLLIPQREGPPYPDGCGMVKCFYCTRLVDLICQVTRARMDGISLLRKCEKFEMNTVH